jgi:ABC-2 type transport system permease protein
VRLYFELARRGYRRYAAYPAATAAGVFTNSIFGFIRGYVLLALFRERSEIGGYDATDTLTYVWYTQGLIATVFLWGWFDLARRVSTGDIAIDLGRGLYHAIFRGIPPLLVGALFFDLHAPTSPLVWVGVVVTVALAVALSYAFRFLYNLSAFWLLDYRGPAIVATILVTFFSGMLVPIHFFPDWLAAISRALPFAWIVQGPVDVFVGASTGAEIVVTVAVQLAWLLALLGLGRLVLAAGTRKLVIQGG